MNDNGILLGKRHFLYCKDKTVNVEGWIFYLTTSFKVIAGGNSGPGETLISLYKDNEKIAQLSLTHKKIESNLTIQAVSSDILLEVSATLRTVTLTEKM
ncbi:hypothetical protein [Brevibacillus sp. SYSU BS000544]|uniref:hypothetical protein n=1 Tax=Brevibacillus sp. SYSU BS000544 TaxID=3416443 RepID=UPI003CE56D17